MTERLKSSLPAIRKDILIKFADVLIAGGDAPA
jgi:hypothetical protein